MTRVKRGNVARKRRERTLKLSSGFEGSSGRLFRVANQRLAKAMQQSFRGRVERKREFRKIWISRMSAAARERGLSYSRFVYLSKRSSVILNRKVVSQLAIHDKDAFNQLIAFIK